MHSITLISMLAFVAQAHAEEDQFMEEEDQFMDSEEDQFMDKLVNRGLKASSLHNDLDESTLGKNQVPGGEVDWQEDSSSIQEVLKASGGDKFTKAEKTPVKAMAMKTLKAVKAGKAMKAMKAMKGMQVAMNTAIKKKKKRVSKIARGKLAKASVFRGFKEKTASGLTRKDLVKNKRGRIVSLRQVAAGKRAYNNIKAWVAAVVQARKALGVKGFVAIKTGTALYNKAKQLLPLQKKGAVTPRKSVSLSASVAPTKSVSKVPITPSKSSTKVTITPSKSTAKVAVTPRKTVAKVPVTPRKSVRPSLPSAR